MGMVQCRRGGKYHTSRSQLVLALLISSVAIIGALSRDTGADSIRIAHIGNSIQFFNDCPNLLGHMMKQKYSSVVQDARFRGGASLVSLMDNPEAILPQFASKSAIKSSKKRNKPLSVKRLLRREWDYIIMNDQTQAPVRKQTKKDTIKVLRKKYLRRIQEYSPSSTVILLMTAAYKSKKVNYSSDLGGFNEFTKKLVAGYESYASVFPNAKIAPLGIGYQYVRENHDKEVWHQLYASDGYHPSPHGTYLEACILYCTIVGEEPPEYQEEWWDTARYKVHKRNRPTKEEADILHEAACRVCGIAQDIEFRFEL